MSVVMPEQPWMTESEIGLFKSSLPPACTALEFGAGGSTRFFFDNGGYKLTSVEGDGDWCARMCADAFLGHFIRKGRLNVFQPDIGPIVEGGCSTPQGEASVLWINYHAEIWEHIDATSLDFICIDGRFRLSCVLQSILHCVHRPIMFVHDFWNRPEYHAVLQFTDVLGRADTAVVLRQKSLDSSSWRKLALCLQKSQFDPS